MQYYKHLKNKIALALTVFGLASQVGFSQNYTLKKCKEKSEIKKSVKYLASDELEGRQTGSKGEALASKFISKKFKENNIDAGGDNGTYFQSFNFIKAYEFGNNTMLLNNNEVIFKQQFYTLSYSSNGIAEGKIVNAGFGINAPELEHNDFAKDIEWMNKILFVDLSVPDWKSGKTKFQKYEALEGRLDYLSHYKPKAIIFYSDNPKAEVPDMRLLRKSARFSFPIVYVRTDAKQKFNIKEGDNILLNTEINKIEGIGVNVIGKIDNKAGKTVVIGAHYDHLGYNEYGGSLHSGESKQIHNGADDNASGVAALITLSKVLKSSKLNKCNYIFIAFSGEEMGLLGSAAYTKNQINNFNSVSYMINMDMVGRLDKKNLVLGINGVGTSPQWFNVIDTLDTKLNIKTTVSGIGASDHSSFYNKGIPAIHFFTGSHSDYHKPSDDYQKLNYKGEVKVVDYILKTIEKSQDIPKFEFAKTTQADDSRPARFKVTLGIMPDYLFEGKGLKVDGVTDGKPASFAGVLAGDILLALGDYSILDMGSYVKALSHFEKGDKTTIKVLRKGKELTLNCEL